jgi:hypothetical protein
MPMSAGAQHPRSPVDHGRRLTIWPTTDAGRWAVWLAAAFFPLVFAAALVPRAAALGFACGLAGGIAALVAIVSRRERGVIVFAALVPVVIGVAFALTQLITGTP